MYHDSDMGFAAAQIPRQRDSPKHGCLGKDEWNSQTSSGSSLSIIIV